MVQADRTTGRPMVVPHTTALTVATTDPETLRVLGTISLPLSKTGYRAGLVAPLVEVAANRVDIDQKEEDLENNLNLTK